MQGTSQDLEQDHPTTGSGPGPDSGTRVWRLNDGTNMDGMTEMVRLPWRSKRSTQQSPPSDISSRPLRFVASDTSIRSQDDEARKTVRSHVMRDFHQKRKAKSAASLRASSKVPKAILQSPASVQENVSASKSIDEQDTNQTDAVSRPELMSLQAQVTAVDRFQYDATSPFTLLVDEEAPFLQMEGKRWPFFHRIGGERPGISLWMPTVNIPLPSPHAPRPCLLKSLHVVTWISNSVEYLEFKGEAIRWLNSRLADTEKGTDDTTIGVIMCLSMLEISRGNVPELALHMDGLLRIINLRGGLHKLDKHKGFQLKLSLVDMIIAIMCNTDPRLPAFTPFHHPSSDNTAFLSTCYPDSPLYGTTPLTTILAPSPFCTTSITLLEEMRAITLSPNPHSHPAPTREPPQQHPSSLLTTISLAASIYRGALTSSTTAAPTLFSSPHNAATVTRLAQALASPPDDAAWCRFPGILLWILLTGAAAAVDRPERGFFVMFLARVGTEAGLGWWAEMRAAMVKFLDVRRRVEGRGG